MNQHLTSCNVPMETMDKATASITPRSVKPKGSVRRHSSLEVVSRGSPSPSTSGEKPLPHYLRASTGSCHDFCKYGRKHESEEKPNNQLLRKLVKNLTMSNVNNQKSSLIPEEKIKKHSVNMKSASLKNMEVSDKTRITKQKYSSGSIESGTSKKIVGQILSPSHIESATGDLALIPASSNIEVVHVKSVDIGDRKKKPSLRQNNYPNRNASTEIPALSLKVVHRKNLSLKSENGAHGKPSIPEEKANSSLQKGTESSKAKLTKQTSLKSDLVQDATRNPVQKTPLHPKVIHPSVQTSLKTIKNSAAKTESRLSSSNSLSSRRNKVDGNIPSMSLGITKATKATKAEGLKVSAASLSTKLAGHGELRLKTKKHMDEKMTSKENKVIGKGGQENNNIEEKKVCSLEINPENDSINHLNQGVETVLNIGPDIVTEALPPKHVLRDYTKFHSLHQGSQEPGINEMVCLKQKGDDDQLSQKLTEPEKLCMDFVQKIPNDDGTLQVLVIPEDISVDSVQQRHDIQASQELQKQEDFSADTQYKTESLDGLYCFHIENMTTSESVDLGITQEDLPTPESNNADTDFSSQELKSLALENQDFGIIQQEFPTQENDAVDHLKQGDEMVVNINPYIVKETMPVIDILGYTSVLEQKGDDDQLSQKLTELEKPSMSFMQQIPNDDRASQELVIPEDISVSSVQQRQNDFQASEELQKSEDFSADTQYKIQSVKSARSDFHMKNMTTSESFDLGITKPEVATAESTTVDIDVSSQKLKSLAPENHDLDKQEPSTSERITLNKEVHSDQSDQSESYDEAEMDDVGEADFIYTESSEYESENDLSEHNGIGQSSKTIETRPRRTTTLHPHDSSAPHKLKFRRGKIIEPQLESNSTRRLRFRRPRVGESEHDNQVGRQSFRRAKTKDVVSNNPDPEAKLVILRHQDMQEKKDASLYNNVIEETASKLVETRKSKVKALVGAFETVISLQDINSASTS